MHIECLNTQSILNAFWCACAYTGNAGSSSDAEGGACRVKSRGVGRSLRDEPLPEEGEEEEVNVNENAVETVVEEKQKEKADKKKGDKHVVGAIKKIDEHKEVAKHKVGQATEQSEPARHKTPPKQAIKSAGVTRRAKDMDSSDEDDSENEEEADKAAMAAISKCSLLAEEKESDSEHSDDDDHYHAMLGNQRIVKDIKKTVGGILHKHMVGSLFCVNV